MSLPDPNPYASPQVESASEQEAVRRGVALLRGPSIGLLILSMLWIVIPLVGGLGALLEWIINDLRSGNMSIGRPGQEALMELLLSLPSLLIFSGAWCMRHGVRYRLALAAAIVACIPFLSPWILLGIPFGIWALVVLCRRDVRAAFDAPRD